MADLSKLDQNAKVFLAGCMKTMIMADGVISDAEVKDIDQLYEEEHFTDFEACLEQFEEAVKSEDDFWNMAEKITDQETREIILSHIHGVSLEDGAPSEGEKKFYNDLDEFWNK